MKVIFLAGTLLMFLNSLPAAAQNDVAKRQKQFNLDDGLAMDGYDPVSYFSKSPTKGKKDLTHSYNGITYRFTTVANRENFKKSPDKYEPAYGGWCSYAMGDSGDKVSVDPETYKIINGKLYLFYNQYFNNTLPKWNKDETNLKKKADLNWKKYY